VTPREYPGQQTYITSCALRNDAASSRDEHRIFKDMVRFLSQAGMERLDSTWLVRPHNATAKKVCLAPAWLFAHRRGGWMWYNTYELQTS
jgi:hypothetical protein